MVCEASKLNKSNEIRKFCDLVKIILFTKMTEGDYEIIPNGEVGQFRN